MPKHVVGDKHKVFKCSYLGIPPSLSPETKQTQSDKARSFIWGLILAELPDEIQVTQWSDTSDNP